MTFRLLADTNATEVTNSRSSPSLTHIQPNASSLNKNMKNNTPAAHQHPLLHSRKIYTPPQNYSPHQLAIKIIYSFPAIVFSPSQDNHNLTWPLSATRSYCSHTERYSYQKIATFNSYFNIPQQVAGQHRKLR